MADTILEPDFHETIVRLADASAEQGALDAKACALLRLAVAIGAGTEERIQMRAAEAGAQGWDQPEIDQTAFLAFATVGPTLGLKALELVRRPERRAGAAAPDQEDTDEPD